MNNKFKLKLLFFIGIFVGTSLCAPRVYLSPNEQYGVFAEIRIAIESKQFERAHAKLNLLQRTSKGVIRSEMLKELQESLAAAEQSVTSCLGSCAICQEDMTKDGKVEDGKDLIAAFECGHVLHRGCILAHGHVRCACCPICRAKVLGEFQSVPMPSLVHAPVPVPVQDEFSVLVRPDDVPQTMWNMVIGSLRDTDGQTLDIFSGHLTSQQLASILNVLPQAIQLRINHLDISYNQLSTLPREIGNLTQLRKLDLFNTHLTALPESIGNLTQLQELQLSVNQLTMLPESIGHLTQLRKLRLSENQLTMLPESIGHLTQLRKLIVNSNHLTALPESIGNLTQLQKLSVYNNQLTVLPEAIQRLEHLEILFVDRSVQLPQLRSEVSIIRC